MIEIKGTINAAHKKSREDVHLFVNPMYIQSIVMKGDHAILTTKGWELIITRESAMGIVQGMNAIIDNLIGIGQYDTAHP